MLAYSAGLIYKPAGKLKRLIFCEKKILVQRLISWSEQGCRFSLPNTRRHLFVTGDYIDAMHILV